MTQQTSPTLDPPEGLATQAPAGITCVLWMGVFFATVWGLRTLLSRLGRNRDDD